MEIQCFILKKCSLQGKRRRRLTLIKLILSEVYCIFLSGCPLKEITHKKIYTGMCHHLNKGDKRGKAILSQSKDK